MTMPEMTKYYIDINTGETPGCRTYLAELQVMELSTELCELDDEQLHELFTDWDNPDGREALENGSVGWGAFTDQNAVVWTGEGGEETVVAVIDVEDALTDEQQHSHDLYLPYDIAGKHAIGVSVEKGGYTGEFELPSDVEFNPELITFGTVSVADAWTIVNTVQYDGEDIYMEGDSTGRSYDVYTFEDDECTHLF